MGKPIPTTTINIPSPGVYTLNGLQALAFARARYGVPGGDIDRGRREQLVIRAMLNKARQIGSLTKIPELYGQFEKNVQTDLGLGDILKLASVMTNLDDVVIRSRYIDGGGLSGMTCAGGWQRVNSEPRDDGAVYSAAAYGGAEPASYGWHCD